MWFSWLFSIFSELLKLSRLIPRGILTHTNKISLPVRGPRLQSLWLAKEGTYSYIFLSAGNAACWALWQCPARETSVLMKYLDSPQPCMAVILLLPLLLPRIVELLGGMWNHRTSHHINPACSSIKSTINHQPSAVNRGRMHKGFCTA